MTPTRENLMAMIDDLNKAGMYADLLQSIRAQRKGQK